MEKNCQCYEDNVVKQIQFVLEGIGLPVVGKEHHLKNKTEKLVTLLEEGRGKI